MKIYYFHNSPLKGVLFAYTEYEFLTLTILGSINSAPLYTVIVWNKAVLLPLESAVDDVTLTDQLSDNGPS